MVSWPDQRSVGLSVILASALTSATHTPPHRATVHCRGVVLVAIESPGQQVNKGNAAGGMSGEEGGCRVGVGWGVKGDSWRGLMGDEPIGERGGG